MLHLATLNIHHFVPSLAPHAFVESGHAIRPATTPRTLAFRASLPVDVAHACLRLAAEIHEAQRTEQVMCARCSRLAVGIDAQGVACCDAHIG